MNDFLLISLTFMCFAGFVKTFRRLDALERHLLDGKTLNEKEREK